MKTKRILSLLLTFLIAMLAAVDTSAEPSGVLEHPDFDRIDRYIQDQMADCRIPGFSLGIIQDGELLYMKGYGRTDNTGRAVTPQTPFIIGSVSKTFTALAVMQLYEAGKVDLDEPVRTYLPSFTLADDRAAAGITVRMLLNHTSGIETDAEFQVCTLRGDGETIQELVAKFKGIQPARQPGEHFSYGNANYIVLGALIEQVSGVSFGTYLQQHIFDPLEMRHSFTSAEDAALDGLARGYIPVLGVPAVSDLPYREAFLPAYSILSCAEDMTHCMTALQGGGRYKDRQIVSADSVRQMMTASVPISEWVSYGLGWHVTSGSVYHGGELADYQAAVRFLPEHGLGVVLMYNTSDSTLSTLLNVNYRGRIESGIINVLFGLDPQDQPGYGLLDLNRYPVAFSYLLLQILAGMTVLLIALSAIRLRSFRKRIRKSGAAARRSAVFTAVLHFALPITVLLGVPAFAQGSWAFVLLYIPDAGRLALGSSLALLAIGLIKVMILIRSLRASGGARIHSSDHTV